MQMTTQKLIKYIEGKIKHKSTRKDDKMLLEDCLETLQSGKELDLTQQGFMNLIIKESKERNKKYTINQATKTMG